MNGLFFRSLLVVLGLLWGTGAAGQEIYTSNETAIVYNLEVARNHNFYVGTSGVLVHNGFDCFKVKYPKLANASDKFFETFGHDAAMLEKFNDGTYSLNLWEKYRVSINAILDGVSITEKEASYLEKYLKIFKSSQLTEIDYIRKYRNIIKLGMDETKLRSILNNISIVNHDIVRLEKLFSYAGNNAQKINNLFDKNLFSGGYAQFKLVVDVYLPAFKRLPVSNVKPSYFSQPNRVFDDINMQHIMDKHSAECFDFNANGISIDIDMFPIGTTQQQVSTYIDEALTILKNTKGANYPLNGNRELVKLSNGMEVYIGSDLGINIKTAPGVFPNNANIIGQFYPKEGTGGITVKSSILKIINEIQ